MTTALAKVVDSHYIAIRPSDTGISLEELLAANVGSGEFGIRDLSSVTVPAGGGMTWSVPHPNGEQDYRELRGVILFAQDERAYYSLKPEEKDEFSEQAGKFPDCSSKDAITGQASEVGILRGLPEGPVECATCPLAQWGSAKGGTGKGQACSSKRQLFMLMPDRLLPIVVTAPSTSLKDVRTYMNDLFQVGQPIWAVETVLTLKRQESGGFKFSTIVSAKAGDLSGEDAAKMRGVAEKFKGLFSRMPAGATTVSV